MGPNRWQFLLDSQADLSSNLTKLNPKSKLLVLREAPQSLLPKLFKAWQITHLVFEKDTDAYARARDDKVIEMAREMNVAVIVKSGRTLWDSDDLVKANGGKSTMSITQVQHSGKKLGEVAKPLPAPTSLPPPGELGVAFAQTMPDSSPDLNESARDGEDKSYSVGVTGPNGDFSVPTMEEIGMAGKATSQHRGGETLALGVLEKVIKDENFTATFSKPATSPAAFEPQSTCLTSPHLHFGTLSVRLFWWRVQEVLDKHKNHSEPPTSLHGQLLFRDMYFGAQAHTGWEFAQTHKNPHARFIPWHLPSQVDKKTGLVTGKYEVDDPQAEEWFRRWKYGCTGFPWIDALMRQLRAEGWIHHLGRHAVACFLTRGGCYISWERGAEVFEEWLVDHETACNAGNWMWLSCVAFYAQFYRCYSPIAFGKKWDPEGAFVRKYVPELEGLNKKYIYEPWKAPIADQRAAGVVIKGNGGENDAKEENGSKVYPKPMFDFSERREVCIQGLKKAYHVGLHGDSREVLDGSWRALFPDAGEGPTEGDKGEPGGTIGSEDVLVEENGTDDIKDEIKSEAGASKSRETNDASPRSTRSRKRAPDQASLESAFKKTKR